MKKTLKKALSMLLTLVIAFSCFALVGNIEAKALPATDYTYARGDKYGTPAWSGTGDRWFKWSNGGSDYVKIYYPSHIYLDVSETLQSAGYHFDVEWHFGDSAKYRILLGAPMWGDNSAYSGYPSRYYTMTNIFSDYKVDASLPPNATGGPYGATYTGSATDYDLRIVGYGHPNQGTDGFTVEGVRHEKYILWRSNTNIGNPAWTSIYLMGTPNSSYKGTTSEYNTSGESFASYGLAQYYNNGWGTDTNGTNIFLGKGDESSYMEGQWIEMAWNVTVYDKSALNSEIVKAGQILSAQSGYNNYVVQGSYDSLVQHNQEAQDRITVRAQTQTDIDNQRTALQNAATALYYGASNTALRNKVAEAEAVIASSDYKAKYTLAAREALEAEVASAKALSYYTNVPTYQAYNNQNAGRSAQSDQTAIDAVLSELQAALDDLNRNKAYYSHIFNMADGTKKTLSGVYGYVIPSASIPANTVKESDAVNHYSYSWDKEINTTITGPEEYTEVLTSTPHDYTQWTTTVYANCTTEGSMYRECTVCGYTQTDVIEKLAHTPLEPEISDEVAASCTAEGSYLKAISCSECGEVISSETVTVPKLSHVAGEKIKENEIASTCTTDGSYEEVTPCKDCGYEISRKTVIVGAAHINGEHIVTRTEPTCSTTGAEKTTVLCAVCSEILSEETVILPVTEHKAGEPQKENIIDAGCTVNGSYDMVTRCKDCGFIMNTETFTTEMGQHNWGEWETVKEADCLNDGLEKRVCKNDSSHVEENILKASGHTEEEIPAVAPTCTEDGLKAGVKCSVCGEVLTAQETDPKLGHDMGEFVVTTPATCTAEGEERSDCSRCDYYETKEIEKAAHTEEEIPAVAPTCTEDGLTAGVKCSVCDEVLTAQETDPKLGHDMGAFIETTPATCTSEGEERSDCSRCDYYETKEIEKAAHTEEEIPAVAPTCTEDGLKAGVKCSVCDEVLTAQETDPKLGHDMGAFIETTPATCTSEGEERSDCSRCDYFETQEIEKKDHTEEEIPAVAPDCLTDGLTAGIKCSVCGEILKAQETDPALGHDMGGFVETIPATCTSEGEERSDCSRCDYFETQEIEKKDHTEEEIPAVAPGCLTDGLTEGIKCSVCGEILKAQETDPALGHDMGGFVETIPATCTAEGEERSDCSRCDYFETEKIEKAAHSWADADCTMPSTCTVCGEVSGTAIGHDMGAFVETIPATCTSEGEERSDCSRCDYYETRATEKAAHTEETIPAVAPDCLADGLTAGIKCSVCGEILKAQETDPALGHDMGAFVETIPATCTSEGEERSDCSRCDYYETQTIEKIAHTEEIIPAVEATCTSTGLTEGLKCSECGEVLKAQTAVEKKAHTEEIIPAVEATCTSTGLTEGLKCSVCGEILVAQTETAKLSHDMGEFAVTKEATCSEAGEERADCANCDYYETKVIAKKAHTEVTVSGKAPTCTEKGLTDGVKCSVCGEIITAQKEISAKGHTFGEWQEVKAPTCTEKGLEEALCSECDYVKTRETDIKDHEYDENGVCTECGTEESCMHLCHRQHNIFARIVWTIIRYICSIFGIGRTCSCGDMHY